MARYEIGEEPYYRRGFWYPPGSVVEIPDDEEPAPGWTRLDADEGGEEKPKATRKRGGRKREAAANADEGDEGTTDEPERPSDRAV